MTVPVSDDHLKAAGWTQAEADGFIAHVGPFWMRISEGYVHMGFIADARHKNRNGVVQGGMVATLADRAMGTAARLENGGIPQATIQLDIHYLQSSRIGDFVWARCRVARRTRHVLFVDADILVGDSLVATAKGIWKVIAEIGDQTSASDK